MSEPIKQPADCCTDPLHLARELEGLLFGARPDEVNDPAYPQFDLRLYGQEWSVVIDALEFYADRKP